MRALCGPAPAGAELERRAREEAEAVLDAAGIDYVPAAEYDARHERHRHGPPGRGPGAHARILVAEPRARQPARSRPTISTARSCCEGRLHGVPAPVNELLRVAANDAARRGAAPGSITEEELLARLG